MISLPTILTKEVWFYEENKEKIEPHLGKPYISYSSVTAWQDYREDFIKQKFVGLTLPGSVYTELGSFVGGYVETGKVPDNKYGFGGIENLEKIPRPKGAKYERFVLLDFKDFVLIGFIDIMTEKEKEATVTDLKTGGGKKEDYYASKEYLQTVLYSAALEQEGYKIKDCNVYFVRRKGSHFRPPLVITDEQFYVDTPYNEKRKEYAINKVKKVVKEISEFYKVYKKYFK